MTITLTPEQEAMVREKVARGHFASPDDVISESLRLLEELDDPLPLEDTRRALAIGLAEDARGDVAELDIQDILSKGRTVLAQSQQGG